VNTFKHAHMVLGLLFAVSALILLSTCIVSGKTVADMRQAIVQFVIGKEASLQTADFQELQTDHFIIKFTSSDEECVNMIGKAAEKAYASVSTFWGEKPARKTMLIIYPDNLSMNESFGWERNEKAMGVYWGGTIRVLTPREWMQDPQEFELFMREGPMVHEFTHLLVDQMTRGNYNRWWTEGVAQYVEKEITGFKFVDPEKPIYYTLSELEKDFDQLDQRSAYWESLLIIEYIVEQYGEESVYEIMCALGNGATMQQALESSLGIGYAGFEIGFYQYWQDI
jgi:hypothetical protein